MTAKNTGRQPVAVWVYDILLSIYPPRVRRRFRADMVEVFSAGWLEARQERRPVVMVPLIGRSLRDLVGNAASAWFSVVRGAGGPKPRKDAAKKRIGWRYSVESVAQDVRYAVRSLARKPALVLVVLVTLAVGIGATTTVFSVSMRCFCDPCPLTIHRNSWCWERHGAGRMMELIKPLH